MTHSTRLPFAAAMLGFTAVALGAFGAHGLEGRLGAEARDWWETATFYALTHAVAAMAIGLQPASKGLRLAGWCLLGGAAIFAGTLYAMALGGPRWFGAVTPLGGTGLLAGWLTLAISALRGRIDPN